ncbi:CIC11C00000000929 [Sungouiella intermedia]|uniref:CIC11C00000000929 n=1 Tax=Sungouiella intermedia TaxID=45354 RepID=A0A1L0DJ73_9ASCO|nr:CIC11C00000000929 [[Candida] intermedia]
MFRSLAPRSLVSRRSVSYILPTIPLLENLKSTNQNFNGLYLSKSIEELWFGRGQAIVNRLNTQLEENKVANPPADLNQLITVTFNKPALEGIYAQASLLHNLQFCLESLKPSTADDAQLRVAKAQESLLLQTPSIATEFSNEPRDEALVEWIVDSFGSIAEFRTLLLNSAKSIKGDGVTWLVAQATYSESTLRNVSGSDLSYNKLAVVNTYNAGIVDDSIRSGQVTKLKQQKAAKEAALKRKQEERKEQEGEDVVEEDVVPAKDLLTLGTVEEAEEALLFLDKKLVPLLALDGSMRAYVRDYGVFGKQQYLENLWDCIDWSVAAKRAPRRFKPSVVFEN